MEKQRTIANPAEVSGVGLHSGNQTRLVFKPAEPNTGIQFVRVDLVPPVVIPALVENVANTDRGTTLAVGNAKVMTVEHVMAAVAGLGIDNILIELDNNEPPVLDGSSLPFVDVLCQAGMTEQNPPKRYVHVEEPIWLSSNSDTHLVVLPDDDFNITYTVDYSHPMLRSQYGSFTIDREVFQREIAPARTFCFMHEVEALRSKGLIKGGSFDNAVVIGEDSILSGNLRFVDEFVRHKILDLIGDLYLLGYPLKGHLVVTRSGHTFNVALVKKLRQYLDQKSRQTRLATAKAPDEDKKERVPEPWHPTGEFPLDIQQIQRILPHRYPFLLVDKILEMDEKRVVGIKNVTINEPFFQGHFPGHPIMPGVLIVEAMAQTCGILMLSQSGNEGKLAYILGIDGAKFRHRVVPGDQLRIEIEIKKYRGKTGKAYGYTYVDGKVVAEGEMTFALVDR
jgi:UDP-3-O-[3-hydroxymyristoyl] N-acetylglucosamine deacetylase/3-hydroxyacyl-[acyl-carrier-protein] dehydratase